MASRPAQHSVGKRICEIALGVVIVDASSKAGAMAVGAGSYGLGFILPIQNSDFSLGVATATSPIAMVLSALGILVFGGHATRAALRGELPAWIPGLLIGGAMANLGDRLAFGAVHDWLDLGKVVVNLADLAVLISLFGYFSLLATTRHGACSNDR